MMSTTNPEKKNKQMAKELQALKSKKRAAADAPHEPTPSTSGTHKSKTPVGRPSSCLPPKSSLWHAMQGYKDKDDDLLSSSSSSSDSGHPHKGNKKGDDLSDSSLESSWSSD
jgi:hypothetical protein